MPTISKVLVVLIVLVSLGFIYLSYTVLEARRNWDVVIKKKAAEVDKVAAEVEIMATGDEDARKLFKEFVEKELLPLASTEANAVYKKKIDEGTDAMAAWAVAMDSFIDSKTLTAFQQSVEKLNDLQRASIPEETQWQEALRAYEAAERDLDQQMKNLDTAYALFLGEQVPPGGLGGIRTIGERKVEGVYRGLGVDAMRRNVVRVGQVIGQQKAIFATMFSDGQKNQIHLADKVAATTDEAATLQKAANGADKEVIERKREVEEEKIALERERVSLAEVEKKLAASITLMNALQLQFDETQEKCLQLTKLVKVKEIEADRRRGVRTVVLTPDGINATGKVLAVDDKDGTIRVAIGTRAGVRKGDHLHVYRTNPERKYLGRLEISESDSDSSVGQMLLEFRQRPIKVDDWVTTEFTPQNGSATNE